MKRTEYIFQSIIHQMLKYKDFNILIDGKSFFNTSIKNKQACEKIIEMERNNGYTTCNLLEYEYFSIHCKQMIWARKLN